jgi:predicted Zn-dependent protease
MRTKTLALSLALILTSPPNWAADFDITVLKNIKGTQPTQKGADIDKLILPDMGDSSGALISPAQDKELGESFFRELHSETVINEDMEIQQYIQTIGHQLAAHSYAPGNPFHFFVVIDPNINAFAGPGGYIGVNSGLILLTEAESELASVMAHEIAHVTQRHLYRSIEQSEHMSIPTIAATLASALLAIKAPSAGMAGMMAVQAGSVQYQINFTRDHEKEADRVGMSTLFNSNFDPRSMPIFFERLQQATRFYGNGVPEFLRTHPMSENRVADTRGRAENYPYRQYPDSMAYALTKAKLAVITEPDKMIALQHFAALEQQGTAEQRAVSRYGIGLANLDLQQFDITTTIFTQLSNEYPNQPQFIAALARTAVESHNYEKANLIFAKAVTAFPGNDPIKIEYIRSLLKSAHPQLALQILDSLSGYQKQFPVYYELLAQSYADLQKPGESHRYLAEYYYTSGQTEEAITQVRLARDEKDLNYQLLAILNERLNFFMSEQEDRKTKRK